MGILEGKRVGAVGARVGINEPKINDRHFIIRDND